MTLWTDDDARAAVEALSDELVDALARGPLEDREDCRVCEVFDPWLFGHAPGDRWEPPSEANDWEGRLIESDPNTDPVIRLTEYHRDQAEFGSGEEAYRRCQVVYAAARSVRQGRHTP